MFTLFVTVIVAIIVILFLSATKLKIYDIMFVALGIVVIGCTIATSPIYGYNEKTLEYEEEIVEISESCYVMHYANDVYLYRCEVKKASDGEHSYKSNILRDNVIETESKQCKNPVVRKYVSKPKSGLFSLCWKKKVEYEFYVPEDTIVYSKESLN